MYYKSRGISYVVALSVLSFSAVLGCRVCVGSGRFTLLLAIVREVSVLCDCVNCW